MEKTIVIIIYGVVLRNSWSLVICTFIVQQLQGSKEQNGLKFNSNSNYDNYQTRVWKIWIIRTTKSSHVIRTIAVEKNY